MQNAKFYNNGGFFEKIVYDLDIFVRGEEAKAEHSTPM